MARPKAFDLVNKSKLVYLSNTKSYKQLKKLICLSIIILIFNACSKKNETITPANTVSIGGDNYSTVVIGTQTWTAANYYGTGGLGEFYTFAQATAINLPAGWRLPNHNDFNNLLESAGGTLDSYGFVDNANPLTLMSKTGWSTVNGTNSLGFNALPDGSAVSPGPTYIGQGTTAQFWSSSLLIPGEPFTLIIYVPSNGSNAYVDKWVPDYYACLRFVKDN